MDVTKNSDGYLSEIRSSVFGGILMDSNYNDDVLLTSLVRNGNSQTFYEYEQSGRLTTMTSASGVMTSLSVVTSNTDEFVVKVVTASPMIGPDLAGFVHTTEISTQPGFICDLVKKKSETGTYKF